MALPDFVTTASFRAFSCHEHDIGTEMPRRHQARGVTLLLGQRPAQMMRNTARGDTGFDIDELT